MRKYRPEPPSSHKSVAQSLVPVSLLFYMMFDYPAECSGSVFNYILYKSIVDAHRVDLVNRALHIRFSSESTFDK